MDPGFCRDAAQSWKKRPTPSITTLDDLEAHLSRSRDSRDSEVLDSACISLLIHCICSMERLHLKYKGNDTASGYGFPYPRVAVHMYNNWGYVWSLVLSHKAMQSSGFTAASMVAHYHVGNQKKKLELGECGRRVQQAITKALYAPMTRLLLMTRGFDVHEDLANDKIHIGRISPRRVVRGDMYVRLARVSATGGEDTEMSKALDAHDPIKELDKLASNRERERGSKRFRCRASTQKGALMCCHDPGDLFCDTASSVGVRYSDAAYREPARAKEPKWRDTVAIHPEKTLQQLDRYETARFLCHQMSDITTSTTRYSVARKIYKRTEWTGSDLARMVKNPEQMIEDLKRLGTPDDVAVHLARRIILYIEEGKTISTIGPCAD